LVTTADLTASYRRCREVNRAHGTTYYWSTRVLPRDKQPHVFALYAFCRAADDIVDDLGTSASVEARAAALEAFGDRFFTDLRRGCSDHELLARLLPPVPPVDGDGPHDRPVRHLG
jgi:phytoene synthase